MIQFGNKRILENFGYLSVFQLFNMLSPLIALPYLVRVLGPEKYGSVVFAQTLALYFSIIINFGFNISAVKDISLNKGDRNKISEIVSSVVVIKFSLWVISFVVFVFLVFLVPSFRQDKLLYLFSFGICFNELLFSIWYFQGIEKMKYVTLINLTARLCFLVLVFLLVTNRNDYYLVPMLYTIGGLVGGGGAIYIMFVVEKICFKLPKMSILKTHFRRSVPFFGAKISTMVRDSSNILILGFVFTKADVAYYDVAMKIVSVFTALFQNVPVVILPKLTRTMDHFFARQIFKYSVLVAIAFYFLLLVNAKTLVLIVGGKDVLEAAFLLRPLGLFSVLYVANTLLNYYLIANDKQNIVYKSTTISLLFYLVMVLLLFFVKSVFVLVLIFIFSSIVDFIVKYNSLRTENLMHWIYATKKNNG